MTIKRYVNIVYFFSLSVTLLFSGTEGQIRGKITNVEGEGLIGAQIYIEELGLSHVLSISGLIAKALVGVIGCFINFNSNSCGRGPRP